MLHLVQDHHLSGIFCLKWKCNYTATNQCFANWLKLNLTTLLARSFKYCYHTLTLKPRRSISFDCKWFKCFAILITATFWNHVSKAIQRFITSNSTIPVLVAHGSCIISRCNPSFTKTNVFIIVRYKKLFLSINIIYAN